MKFRLTMTIIALLLLPTMVFARPYGKGPAGCTELFYAALSSGDLALASSCVHPDDRASLALASAVAQWYASGSPDASGSGISEETSWALDSSVLSWVNDQGMPVYWFEPSRYAKVVLSPGEGKRFVFVLELVGQDWLVRLDRNALGFMLDTRKAGTDPDSLRTTGRRTPGYQAREFVAHLSSGNFALAQLYVSAQSRNLFSLLSVFQNQGQPLDRNLIRILDESARDDTATVDLDLGNGRRISLNLVLQDGEWLVRFDS